MMGGNHEKSQRAATRYCRQASYTLRRHCRHDIAARRFDGSL